MRHLIGRICLVVSLSAVLITTGCTAVLNESGIVAPAAQPQSETAPTAEPEPPPAAAGPESGPAAELEPPAAEPDTTTKAITTELRMEIGEPVEGVEPASPVPPQEEEPDMPANLRAQSIPQGEAPLAAAIDDLVAQTGLPPEQIDLVLMEAVEWGDTSLGCPEEGYMYAQVITAGYRIILEAQGVQYEYHTDEGTNVVLCQP